MDTLPAGLAIWVSKCKRGEDTAEFKSAKYVLFVSSSKKQETKLRTAKNRGGTKRCMTNVVFR